jgi:hypothetical protein
VCNWIVIVIRKKLSNNRNKEFSVTCNQNRDWPCGSGADFQTTSPHFLISWSSPLWRGHGPPIEQTWILFNQGQIAPSLIEFGLLVLEKKIFKNFQCIFTLSLLSLLGEGQSPSVIHLESPSPKDDLWWVWLKLVLWFWRRSRKCKSLQMDNRRSDF